MEKVPLEILALSPSESQGSNSFAVILGEIGGKRRLPIIIGMPEAQAIAIEIEKIRLSRPMTHDLFKAFAEAFSFILEEVVITGLQEGIFMATIIGQNEDNETEIKVDARPSDAIAIALRFDIPIYVYENILDEAGIVLGEENEEITKEKQEEHTLPFGERLKRMQIKELKSLLERKLSNEDYEKAARIRDEINRRN